MRSSETSGRRFAKWIEAERVAPEMPMQELDRQHAPGVDEGWHRSPMSSSVRKKADGPLVLLSGHRLSLTVRLVTSRLKLIRAKGFPFLASTPRPANV